MRCGRKFPAPELALQEAIEETDYRALASPLETAEADRPTSYWLSLFSPSGSPLSAKMQGDPSTQPNF